MGAALWLSILGVMQSSGRDSVSKPPLGVHGTLSRDTCPPPSGGWDIHLWHEHTSFCPACRTHAVHEAKQDWAGLRGTLVHTKDHFL